MPEMPALGGGYAQQYGAVSASSIGTTVTASASANTKGTVVELTAATEHDAHWIAITIVTGGASGTAGLLDILIGASTEAVLIANLQVISRAVNEGGGGQYLFPLFIAKGSRLAAAYQNGTGSSTVEVVVHLFGGSPLGPYAGCTYVDRYGATASSQGTAIDPGAVADTYSAWAAIANPTLRPIRWLMLSLLSADLNMALTKWTIQVGIGVATEQVIVGDLLVSTGLTLDCTMPTQHFYLPLFVPTGSVLSVRAKCNSTVASDRVLATSLFGAG